jgi:hypothetical protein
MLHDRWLTSSCKVFAFLDIDFVQRTQVKLLDTCRCLSLLANVLVVKNWIILPVNVLRLAFHWVRVWSLNQFFNDSRIGNYRYLMTLSFWLNRPLIWLYRIIFNQLEHNIMPCIILALHDTPLHTILIVIYLLNTHLRIISIITYSDPSWINFR